MRINCVNSRNVDLGYYATNKHERFWGKDPFPSRCFQLWRCTSSAEWPVYLRDDIRRDADCWLSGGTFLVLQLCHFCTKGTKKETSSNAGRLSPLIHQLHVQPLFLVPPPEITPFFFRLEIFKEVWFDGWSGWKRRTPTGGQISPRFLFSFFLITPAKKEFLDGSCFVVPETLTPPQQIKLL